MKKRVPKPFILLLFFFLLSNYLSATPECPIITGAFNLANGATSDPSSTGWFLDASHVTSNGYFAVKSNRIMAQTLGGEGIWYSRVFSTAGYSNFQAAVKISSEGQQDNSEYVKIYYKIDGGPETQLDARTGNFGTIDFTSGVLNGNNIQLIVKLYDYTHGSQASKYYIEQYRVFKEKGPCAVSSINVTATGGVLTCSNSSVALSATATGSGTTTWSWTGPNGFTSTAQNPTVSTAGTYTVVATNGSGSGSASATVTENKTPPTVTATGGQLTCGLSVTLNASSSVSNATYRWTGPNNFTSTTQNPTVSTVGTYTVTVTDPSNGCSASATATVSGSASSSTLWLEDFTGLANGTTSDNGATAWTATTTGTGTYSVQNGEFKTSFNEQSEGVWTSQVIDISSTTNATFSVDLRSEVTSGSVFETADYIRVYYKLNGGNAVLAYEDLAGIGSSTSGTASFTFASSSLSGSTLQIIIKTNNSDPTERYYFDNIKVSGVNSGANSVSISQTGNVTCTATAQLNATASSSVTAWSWTGPNNFTSTAQNPVVNTGGQYVVTATLSGGCTVSGAITVAENKAAPDITATGGNLACLSGITLSANSSVTGATYSWTGPNNFTSTSKNPIVSAAGTYTATVTNPANGCTASQSVTVTSGSTTATVFSEDFTLTNGTTSRTGTYPWSVLSAPSSAVFSVQSNEFRISNIGTTGEGVWASGVLDITGKTNISISAVVRSSVTGSAVMNTTGEFADYLRFYYKLNNGSEVLFAEKDGAINNNSTTTTPISVSGLSGTSLQIIVRGRATGNDEFYYFDNMVATGNVLPSVNVLASANSITCTNATATLSGNSTVSGVSWSWTGPNNFTSTVQNPTTTVGGIYTLTVTDPSSGCSGTDTALVAIDKTGPGAAINVTGAITCNTGSADTLTGSSSTAGVTYSWTGPNNFTSTQQSPVVTTTGTYYLTVTNPVNGCTSTANTTVTQSNTARGTQWLEDFNLPNGTTSDTGPTSWSVSINPSTTLFSVLNNEFRISNSSTTGEGVWTSGVIDITGKTNVAISTGIRSSVTGSAVMNTTGVYADYLRFYYKLDNGAEVLFAENLGAVNNHSTTPTIVSVAGLSGSSLQIVVRARATGNDEFYYFDNMQVVSTGAANVTATATGGAINCINNSVTLAGNSGASGATYTWTGPNNYTSSLQNPVVTTPGNYTLKVTLGSCNATAAAVVSIDTARPNITASVNPAKITCITTSATLTGGSSTQGVNYSWSNASGVIATTATTPVTSAGTYTLRVTNPANGCAATAVATVSIDSARPNISASATPIQLTCVATNASLTGNSTTPGVSYSWSNGSSVIATTANASVNTPGTYILTVTNPTNGCTASSQVAVTQNVTPPPAISAASSGEVTCNTPNASITGTVSTPGLTYGWTGPNGYTSSSLNAAVKKGGTYTLTATDPTNGCSTSATVVVEENTTPPGEISINNSGTITCLTSSITISGRSSTSNVSYAWTGPNGYGSSSSAITVMHGGLYTLTATDPANGCKTSKSTNVAENTKVPAVTITNTSPLSCNNPTVTLTATTATVNAGYLWIGPDGFVDVAPITTATEAGTYYLTVTDPANGCTTNNKTDVTGDPNDCSARKATTGGATNASAQNATTAVTSFTYSAYPNPVTTNGVIQFTSPLSTTVTVGIYNSLGACEKVLFKGTVAANQQYRLSVPANQLHAGSYYYIINTNGKVYTGKLVVVK